ncbi:MAG: hypothetical protein IJD68_00085 [Ruminococcus sp.]|nr:hypothetical protein [Ruminococcus sp.]
MKKSIITIILALVMSLACLTGCGQSTSTKGGTELASGGVLVLSVNPEIAVEYDKNGLVTNVSARNDDAMSIISNCKDLIGKETREVVTTLVSAIGEAGYFVEEVEGERRQITIEIESGSKLPHDAFLDEVVSDVRDCVNKNNWNVPMDVENESDYGITDYVDTDYGPENDGVTDYDDTDYGPENDGVTDYDDTDYDPNNDGVTDYDDGQSNYDDGNSNYNDGNSDYKGPVVNTPPVTSGNSDYGQSNYDDGNSNYDDGNSDYKAPVVNTPPVTSSNSDYGQSDYNDSASDYDDGNSNYDDGNSDYDNGSDYGNSDYDD